MKTLIYCCSVYQLFNAVNLRLSTLKEDSVDLLLADYLPNAEQLVQGAKDSGVFDHVFFTRSFSVARQQYPHTRKTVYEYRLFPNRILKQTGFVPKARYDRFYFATYDDYISFLFLSLHGRNKKLECACYEDGGTTYMQTDQTTNGVERRLYKWLRILPLGMVKVPVLVYEPELMTFDCGAPVYAIPKIRADDAALRKAVNTVFGFDSVPEIDGDAIFFEESFLADGLQNNDEELIRLCSELLGGRMLLKSHPRNPYNRFEGSEIRLLRSNVPWEVFCLNADFKGKTLITVNSNAAISPHILFETAPKTVLLYHMLVGKSYLLGKPEYEEYYRRLEKIYAGEIAAPKDKEALKEELCQ